MEFIKGMFIIFQFNLVSEIRFTFNYEWSLILIKNLYHSTKYKCILINPNNWYFKKKRQENTDEDFLEQVKN